jgi:hypothetical protein
MSGSRIASPRSLKRAPPAAEVVSDAALDTLDHVSPHCAAMSVALDDHGEIVPRRGTTSSNCPWSALAPAAGP